MARSSPNVDKLSGIFIGLEFLNFILTRHCTDKHGKVVCKVHKITNLLEARIDLSFKLPRKEVRI